MIPKRVTQFAEELSALCNKYGLRGIAGVYLPTWYDDWITVQVCDPTDTGTQNAVDGIAEYLADWADEQAGADKSNREVGTGLYRANPNEN